MSGTETTLLPPCTYIRTLSNLAPQIFVTLSGTCKCWGEFIWSLDSGRLFKGVSNNLHQHESVVYFPVLLSPSFRVRLASILLIVKCLVVCCNYTCGVRIFNTNLTKIINIYFWAVDLCSSAEFQPCAVVGSVPMAACGVGMEIPILRGGIVTLYCIVFLLWAWLYLTMLYYWLYYVSVYMCVKIIVEINMFFISFSY